MARPVDPNRPVIEANILLTAARLFAERGYEATSIQDIADAVGMHKSSLYHYINGKEQLLFEALSHTMDLSSRAMEEVLNSKLSAADKMRQAIRVHIANVMERRHTVSLFLGDGRFLMAEQLAEYVRQRDRYENAFKQIITDGIQDGSFGDVDVSLATKAIVGICNYLVQWYSPDGRLDPDGLAAYFAHLVVDRMLSPAVGDKLA